ncbi:MAG TPA: hypothetical protein VIM02_12040 [Rhizomicrobium sp.]
MSQIDDGVAAALKRLLSKPLDTATQAEKKRYSELVSQAVALALAAELRGRGMREARPTAPGEFADSGAERRMSGGIGAKKVDVTWTTPESGLLLGISIKTINFRDTKTKNFQKNLTNRRSDMLVEAVTLHRRFPYAVLAGFFFLDKGAAADSTSKRRSTFYNAHARMKLFTGRADPAGRDEQFERLYIFLLDAGTASYDLKAYSVGVPEKTKPLSAIIDELIALVAERNPDFYEVQDGKLIPVKS